MSTLNLISLLIMAAFYMFAGVSHFRRPVFFLSITPKWVPFPKIVNFLVGGIEIIAGFLLFFDPTRSYAAWSIVILLILVFPANVYHFQKAIRKKQHILFTAMRLPMQLLLLYWAYGFMS